MRLKEYNRPQKPKRRNMASRHTDTDIPRDVTHRDRKHDYHRHDKFRKGAEDWYAEYEDDFGDSDD